ncbi:hypothetical protein N0V90_010367 [Kalmusia sp. IMI 367209]|nr:hypothetical protein N0V90_010367 [Kalmusia sp. IMI 367209]
MGKVSVDKVRIQVRLNLECSVSEASEDAELLMSSQAPEPRTGKLWEVRSTGLPFLPRPSLDGLPGAPSGSLSLTFLGTTIWQFSHTSGSESKVLLGLRPPKLLSDAGKLGK